MGSMYSVTVFMRVLDAHAWKSKGDALSTVFVTVNSLKLAFPAPDFVPTATELFCTPQENASTAMSLGPRVVPSPVIPGIDSDSA